MSQQSFWHRAYHLYIDGFRQMTLGRTLWLVIIVKLIVIFGILKFFFFRDYVSEHAQEGQESEFVAGEILQSRQ
ncbi:MAG: DUF4492 domain-containing protein [Bacteroidaceae bacterium]|nr:DUF4492 domain-containing protein [Bacteroidaceae bacterium]